MQFCAFTPSRAPLSVTQEHFLVITGTQKWTAPPDLGVPSPDEQSNRIGWQILQVFKCP